MHQRCTRAFPELDGWLPCWHSACAFACLGTTCAVRGGMAPLATRGGRRLVWLCGARLHLLETRKKCGLSLHDIV